MISKGERTELRSVVRQQFKVLRSEVQQREAELLADVEDEIVVRFKDDDERWAKLQHDIKEAVLEANRRVNDALYEGGYQPKGDTEQQYVRCQPMTQPEASRMNLRRAAHARITAQMRAALMQLDRQEADLLRSLAVGSIESEEARAFLADIPTVAELVPAARLAELEAQMDGDKP